MGDIAVAAVKWAVRLGIIISLIFAFTILYNLAYSMIGVTINQSVIGDLLSLVQMWLPFDLDVLMAWLFTGVGLYITYRVAMFAAGAINKFVGEN